MSSYCIPRTDSVTQNKVCLLLMALLLAAGKLYPEALLTLAVRFITRHAELQVMLDTELIFTE